MTDAWDAKGNAVCGCGKVFIGAKERRDTVQMLRARGWHHSEGVTQGGVDYEALLCPGCARDERRRSVSKPTLAQDVLPFDWEELRVIRGEGFQSR